jgi:hypothetical protein
MSGTRLPGSDSLGPVALPVLPATGADSGALTHAALLAVAAGVPLLLFGHRRRRRAGSATA